MSRKDRLTLAALFALLACLLVARPGSVPPIWFDEGWALSIARNWVELGHYGHLLMGEPVPATILNTGFPAVAPMALSFRIFGIGVWQGRLPGMLFTLAAFCALYLLADRLYDRSVAVGAIATALLLSVHMQLHPVVGGRQALGEMPALFFLVVGFWLFTWAWQRPGLVLPLSSLCWALALRTKPQLLPFIILALSISLAVTVLQRAWRSTWLLAVGLTATLALVAILGWGQAVLMGSPLFTPTSGNDPYSMVQDKSVLRTYVITLELRARATALLNGLAFAAPLLLGLSHAPRRWARDGHEEGWHGYKTVCRLTLWILCCSWVVWFLFFSIGFRRYLAPAVFVGNLFVAAWLQDVMGGFSYVSWLRRGAEALKQGPFNRARLGIVILAILLPAASAITVIGLFRVYGTTSDRGLSEMVRYITLAVEPDAVIETYDSELFVFLENPYHYPPDSVQHQLNRRFFLGQKEAIAYDPLVADPDYLAVGPMSRMWGLYEPVLQTNAFRLIRVQGEYELYERVR